MTDRRRGPPDALQTYEPVAENSGRFTCSGRRVASRRSAAAITTGNLPQGEDRAVSTTPSALPERFAGRGACRWRCRRPGMTTACSRRQIACPRSPGSARQKDFDTKNGGKHRQYRFTVGSDGVVAPARRCYGQQLRRHPQVTDAGWLVVINTHHHPDHFLGNQAFRRCRHRWRTGRDADRRSAPKANQPKTFTA